MWFSNIIGWWNGRVGNTGIFNKNCRLRLHTTLLETGQLQNTHFSTAGFVILPVSDLVKSDTAVCFFVKMYLQTSMRVHFEVLTVYSGLLAAGSARTVWLSLQTKPMWMCFQLSCCADAEEPGFPLVGGETDTWYLTDWAFPVYVCILLGSSMGTRICQQNSCSRRSPPSARYSVWGYIW